MNLIYKKPLVVAIAAAVGSLIPFGMVMATDAIVKDGDGVYAPVNLPLESKEATTTYTAVYDGTGATNLGGNEGDLEAYIYTVPGYPVSASKNLSVKLTLTNGAKFQVKPYLICPSTGNNDSYGVAGISAAEWTKIEDAGEVIAGNTTNAHTAYRLAPLNTSNMGILTYEFPQGFTIPTVGSGACLLTYSANVGTLGAGTTGALVALKGGAAGQNIDMTVEVTYQDVFASVTKTSTVPLIKFVTAYVATVSKDNIVDTTKSDVTIDVKTDSKKFVLKDGSNVSVVFAGSVIVSASNAEIRNATGALVSAADLFSSAQITIEGETVSTLSSITFANAAVGCGTTLASPVGVPASTTAGVGSVKVSMSTTDAAYTALVNGGGLTALAVCLNTNGNVPMNDGQLTMTVNGVSPAGAAFEMGNGNLALVGRNGTVVRVLNIPNSKTTADRSFIRFYNTSNQPVVVTGILYGQDGKALGSTSGSKLFDPLYANDVKALTADQLAEKVLGAGKTADWTGRAWLMIQAPISSDFFKVQSLIRSPNGTLINVSSDATD